MDEFINSESIKSDSTDTQTVKITSNLNQLQHNSNDHFVGNTMNIYLKKHKLDLTLLPNKKMIKLSDLTSTYSANNRSSNTSQINDLFKLKVKETENEAINHSVEHSEDDLDDYDDEEDDDESDYSNDETKTGNGNESNASSDQLSSSTSNETTNKENKGSSSRKKREPSLKLQQRLSNEDLELIVNCVRNRQANIYIADVKKDQYVDKILKVKLLTNELSNGKDEALLKKSMFPKDLNTLFETFINSLCGQEQLIDENGIFKPTLTCLVVECGFKSFSEAEIMRHIKRHLAQDGYTCQTCAHQFASMTNLQRHLKIHSGEIGKEIKCSLCDYKASTITHVKRHMAHKHLERALPCPHCSFMGATNAELKIHMARKHLELTGKNPLFLPKYLRKDYHCNICKEQYNDFKEYQTHMYEHTSTSNRFQCTECPYNCKNYSKLKRHMLYHSGARNYSCDLCGNKFFQMEHLKRHMQSIHNIVSPTNSQQTSTKVPKTKTKKMNLNQDKLIPTEQATQQSYKVTSRCMYKCQQCDYSTVKIYSLNEHINDKHSASNNTNISQLISQEIHFEDYESLAGDDSQDDEEEDDLSFVDDIINNYSNDPKIFSCSFCAFTVDKKQTLRVHLQENHSSQASAPVLLSNDSVLAQPNTKFKCDTCKLFLDNINDYIKHMNETHKIQVFLLDTNCESSSTQTQQTYEKPPNLNSTARIKTKKSVVMKQPRLKSSTTNRRPPSRLQQNPFNSQNTTVRINPLIFKQQQNSQPFQINFTKNKQSFKKQQQQQQLKQQIFDIVPSIMPNQRLVEIEPNQFEFSQANSFLDHNDNMIDNNLNLMVNSFQN